MRHLFLKNKAAAYFLLLTASFFVASRSFAEQALGEAENLLYVGERGDVDAYGKTHLGLRAIYIANVEGIRVFRGTIHKLLKEIHFSQAPAALLASKKGDKVYALLADEQKIAVINSSSFNINKVIRLGDAKPTDIVVNVDETLAYVTDAKSDALRVVDLENKKVLKSIATGTNPSRVVMDGQGKLFVSNTLDGTVSVIDPDAGKSQSFSAGKAPFALALSKDGQKIFVTDLTENSVLIFNASDFSKLSEIKVGESPYALIMNKEGDKLYVANRRSNSVSIIDLNKDQEISKIEAGDEPSSLVMTPEEDYLYVANEISGNTSVISLAKNAVVQTLDSHAGSSRCVISTPQRPVRR